MDETGSRLMAGLGISGVEPSGSATRELISKMNLREIGCEDGRWMKPAQDRVQWRALVLAVSILFALPLVDKRERQTEFCRLAPV